LVVSALGIRWFAIEAFKIPAASMWPTFHIQDHVFVTKSGYEPKRGELIVFEYPKVPGDLDEPQDFVKRVVGLPGDAVLVQEGRPVINGKQTRRCDIGPHDFDGQPFRLSVEFLDEQAYITASAETLSPGSRNQGPYQLGPDEVFVLGDNRDNSYDSRMWLQGPGVPLDNIKGRVWIIWLSFQQVRRVIDWARIGQHAHGTPLPPRGASAKLEARLAKCLAGWTPPG
jgi:signal peptidase I